jgi:hypothetical protein
MADDAIRDTRTTTYEYFAAAGAGAAPRERLPRAQDGDAAPPPLHIWQTWREADAATFPPIYAACQPSWREVHPHAAYTLLTDDDGAAFCAAHFPLLARLYAAVPLGVMRADLLRYMVLFVHGGLYADMDCQALRDHTPLWEASRGVVLGRLNNARSPHSLPNAWMLSKRPRDIFWLAVLEEAWARCERAGVLRDGGPSPRPLDGATVEELTGPIVVHHVACEYYRRGGDVADLCPQLLVAGGGVATTTRAPLRVLPADVVYACDWNDDDRERFVQRRGWATRPREEIAAELPRSLAWTPWAHNW